MTDAASAALSGSERRACAEAGVAVHADRIVLDAQPPVDEATLAAVAQRCAGPLPIGGFEYLDRVYVTTAAGPGHGAVMCRQQGLPAGWELTRVDRAAPIAADLPALFTQLVLESDPWEAPSGDGADLRDAVEELSREGDPRLRSAAGKLRHLVQASVLDWRGALRARSPAGAGCGASPWSGPPPPTTWI